MENTLTHNSPQGKRAADKGLILLTATFTILSAPSNCIETRILLGSHTQQCFNKDRDNNPLSEAR